MKISEIILSQGLNRRFRGPRKPRLKQKGFHQRMKALSDAKQLEEDKNTHLDHAEELVFNQGTQGIKRVVTTFSHLLDAVDGAQSGDSITTKWDGSPAVFAGIDPEDGQFFVGTKGVFAKTPKLNKTKDDIKRNHSDTTKNGEPVSKEGLRNKLYRSLEGLKDLNIQGVLQGDMLFTQEDLKEVTIDGEKMLAFKPNTITYVVPANSKTAKEMRAADMGIVFHTSYSGDSVANMKASFGFDSSSLTPSSNVWFTDARIKDVSGQVQMSGDEVKAIKTAIKELAGMTVDEKAFKIIDAQLPLSLTTELKAHANKPIRSGQAFEQDASKFAKDFYTKVHDTYEKAIEKLKTGREGSAGQRKVAQQQEMLQFIEQNAQSIATMYTAYLKVEAIKMMFQRKMRDIKSIDSFIEQPDGSFKVTDPEGFVIVDHIGRAMKIVDRLEFSAANFAPRD